MHHSIFLEAEKFAQDCLDQISEESFPEILKQKPRNLEFQEDTAQVDAPIGGTLNHGVYPKTTFNNSFENHGHY